MWCAYMDEARFEAGVLLARLSSAVVGVLWGGSAAEFLVNSYFNRPPARRVVEELPELIEDSRKDRAVWDVVNMIAQREFRSGTPLPRQLTEWVVARLKEERQRPGIPGRDRQKYLMRNQQVVSAVQFLVECGFQPTRNKGKRMQTDPARACAAGGSACDAAAFAVDDRLSYQTVEGIWTSSKTSSRQFLRPYHPLLFEPYHPLLFDLLSCEMSPNK